ncbi:hypothetical protein GCM10027088_11560 [Nocardia goodfellowii]|uniref:Uncharacterized protein n=1 Tax=Nocardia goodfellowii TaxID=882446 RepID=A0ABS4QED8_9NOCA|nr:hypothetical protein [Nocardia goodfellowii]MBP2190052.1 hypothetical protein [Nocardia goodfellowii]
MSTQHPGDGEKFPDATPPTGEPGEAHPGWPVSDQGQTEPQRPELALPPEEPRYGSIQRQEPGRTQPRPPTVAEARARDKARQRADQERRAAEAAEAAKKKTRKRVLMGSVAVVGVAGLVGGGYLVYKAVNKPDQVTAHCVQIDQNGKEVVVPDDKCGPGKQGFSDDDRWHGGGGLIILGGWPQYRYYYGGNPTIGQAPVGGSTVKPKGAEIKTKSGTTVQRGGLGSKSSGGGS